MSGNGTGISSRAEKLRQQIASSREDRLLLAHKCVSLTRKQSKSIAGSSSQKNGNFIELDHNSNNGNLLVAAFRKGISHSILGDKLANLTQKQHAEISLQVTSAACASVPCACSILLRSPKARKIFTSEGDDSDKTEILLYFCAVCGGYIPKQGGCGLCTGFCDSTYPCVGCKGQSCQGGCCLSISPASVHSNNSSHFFFSSTNNVFHGSTNSSPHATPKSRSQSSLINTITSPPELTNYYYNKNGIPHSNIILPTLHRLSDWLVNGELYSLPPTIKKPPISHTKINVDQLNHNLNNKGKVSLDPSTPLYESIRLLGRGSFGEVNLIKNPVDSKLFALKSILCNNKHEFHMVMREVQLLRLNRHPYIMDIHDAFIVAHNNGNGSNSTITAPPLTLYYIMPYCESGTLDGIINSSKRNNISLSENQIIKYFIQICLGLQCLHANNCIHRDLKPQNLLLMEGGDVLKIADFGLAITINKVNSKKKENDFLNFEHDKLLNTEAGTPYYSSPELILCQGYSYPLDMWSLGIILYQMMCLVRPFEANSTSDLVKKIIYLEPKSPPSHYSDDLKGICHDLLIKSSKKRMNLNDLLCHPLLFNKIMSQPGNYRPKFIEERVKRNLIKQLEIQVDVVNKLKKHNDKIIIREQQIKRYHQLNKKTEPLPLPSDNTPLLSPPRHELEVGPYSEEDSEELTLQLNKYSKFWRGETITSDYRIDQNIDDKKMTNNSNSENNENNNSTNSLLQKKSMPNVLIQEEVKPVGSSSPPKTDVEEEEDDEKQIEEGEYEEGEYEEGEYEEGEYEEGEEGEEDEEEDEEVNAYQETDTIQQHTESEASLGMENPIESDFTQDQPESDEINTSDSTEPHYSEHKGGIIGSKLSEALEQDLTINTPLTQ